MKFPGSKLLHSVDLSMAGVSLMEVVRSCQKVGLTGMAEITFPDAMGMIFFYCGNEVNALFREGAVAHNGQAALERLEREEQTEGAVAVYELPLDIAHLLRGITQRRRLKDRVACREDFDALVSRLETAEHTGTLEVHTSIGSAMLLLVKGRVSNVYWETNEGVTFEKGEARRRLERALALGEVQLVLSDFSQEVWKVRQDITTPIAGDRSRSDQPPSTDVLVSEEMANRNKTLDEIVEDVPALLQAVFFDVMTGVIHARRMRGTSSLRVNLLADRMPALAVYLRDLALAEDDDLIESIEIGMEKASCVMAIIAETQEGIAALAEKSQPLASIHAALDRCVRNYVSRLRSARKTSQG